MIPKTVSWQYKRLDIQDSAEHGICCPFTMSVNDIQLWELVPKECESFLLFLCLIKPNSRGGDDVILSLKTRDKISDDEYIQKNVYYSSYLIPTTFPLYTYNLVVRDMFDETKFVSLDYPQVFNDSHLNNIHLPLGTFISN